MAIPVLDLGRLCYSHAYSEQTRTLDEVVAARAVAPMIGKVLLVEHVPPVITITRRPEARQHLLATEAMLARLGVEAVETDRGGDITYHGPGQLVVYPIIDLNALNLGLHDYLRLLEEVVIRTVATFGVNAARDPGATGVWVGGSKICAMGVRVRKWVTMHGLALNVTTNLDHFNLIVPCGLHGRPVTSLARELGGACPTMEVVKGEIVRNMNELLDQSARAAAQARAAAAENA